MDPNGDGPMNAPQATTHMFDLAVAPVLASEPFADLCRSLSRDRDIIDAVTMRAMERRDSWTHDVSPTAWCHAIARQVVAQRRNDRRVFERQVMPLRSNLYSAAMKLTRDPSDADDLVQDTLLRAWAFWASFTQGTNLKAWLFTVLRNTFINGYHRRGRKRDFQNDVTSQMRSLGPTVAVGHSCSSPPGPEDAVAAEAQRVLIREALDSLPTDYRIAVSYADLDGLSYKEIAAAMECPIGTVMSRIYRGRRMLQGLLHAHAVEIGLASENDRPAEVVRLPVASAQCELFAAGWE
jgi:RNA polymerase sigma-70 factor (ECF subfamily)